MGASASSIAGYPDAPGNSPITELDDVPESCIALVLSYLDPPEMARLAGVNRAFHAASSADFIWIPKLPSNSSYILSKLSDRGVGDRRGRDIYAALCRRSSFDGGDKEVWIDKRTGGVCLAISSKAMAITGIDDRRYWNHVQTHESRFETVACLQQIWWLEVDGEVEFRYPRGTYSLFFRLKLGRVGRRRSRRERESSCENVHGWDTNPAQFRLKTHDGQHAASRRMLATVGSWVHYHVGDFAVDDDDSLTKIRFSLTQIDCTHTKGGLCVDSVLICPTSVGRELYR